MYMVTIQSYDVAVLRHNDEIKHAAGHRLAKSVSEGQTHKDRRPAVIAALVLAVSSALGILG